MPFPSSLPPARTPPSIDAPPLRWGILGTGWIARRFVGTMRQNTRQDVYAVGSRSLESARAFAVDAGVEPARCYGSYEELVGDSEVDVVYVATPHHLHVEHALLSLSAGRNTFVEKPIGLNDGEVLRMTAAAAESGLFLREALWSAYLPKFDVIRQLLDDEVLGTIHSVQADMGEYFPADHRIMRADLAGGARYDLLTYPLWFARWVLGPLETVQDLATPAPPTLSPDGVEGQIAVVQRNAAGRRRRAVRQRAGRHAHDRHRRRLPGHPPAGRTLLPTRRLLAPVARRAGAALRRTADRARRTPLRGGRRRPRPGPITRPEDDDSCLT